MKKISLSTLTLIILFLPAAISFATPSTTYWTPMTLDIQPYGVLHIGGDNYFTILGKHGGHVRTFTPDFGPEIGVLPFDKVQMEVGFDYLGGADYPWFFNAKIGSPEDSFFKGQPALEVGIFNVGTKTSGPSRTDFNIVHFLIGKTLPANLGRLTVGPYIGNHSALVSGTGKRENIGFMVGYDHGFIPAKDKDGNEYNKFVLAADYATGKNALGGGGVGLYYYFTKDISLLTGPVWFNDQGLNGKWKWTIQLDINTPQLFNWFQKKKP